MKKLLVLALISGTAYGAWNVLGSSGEERAASSDLKPTDRLWLDRLPRTERDTINVFVTITDERLGVFQAGSRWRAAYELFHFEAQGDQLEIVYPQTSERERVTAKVTACDENGMDYCMDVVGATRGVKRYYSMKGWEIDGGLDAVQPKLDAVAQPRQATPASS